jgi:hypothetical protein
MAAIKATKKVTPAEMEKGVPLALLENNLQKSKMKNGASPSMRPALSIDPIFRKRDEFRKYDHDHDFNNKAIGSSSFRLLLRQCLHYLIGSSTVEGEPW